MYTIFDAAGGLNPEYLRALMLVCPLVFFAGFVDSIAGGGGLISMPAFLAAGIPPHGVLGSNKFAATFGASASLFRFYKNGHIHIKIAAFSVVASLIGSSAGASLTLLISPGFLRAAMLILLPVILVFIMLKRDFGQGKEELLPEKRLIIFSVLISLAIGMYDGFFGPGTGSFLILCFTSILGYDILTASGNAKAVNFASNIAALAVFLVSGHVIFTIAIPAALFNLAGGYLGSGLAIKNGLKIIKPVFVVVMLLLMAKIIYDINS